MAARAQATPATLTRPQGRRSRGDGRWGLPRPRTGSCRATTCDALAWLRAEFEGRFRCVYMDPPFNTGRTFAEYDDARSPAEWRAFLRERLLATVPLLAADGALFLEIDDSELGAAITLCDEVFGRAARVSTVTVVRSASTGHKAKNRGPVNVTDFILIYAKEPGAWTYRPARRVREGYDARVQHLPREPARAGRRVALREPPRGGGA